jgi:PAS domain S-box
MPIQKPGPVDTGSEMFSLFELTPDLVCVAGKDGYFKKVNPAVLHKLGYTPEEIYSKPIADFIHPDDRERTQQVRGQLLLGERLLNFQNRYVASNGTVVWLEWTSIYITDKEVVFAIAKDISGRKKEELEIEEKYKKFRSLATHFKKSIEEDRKWLAVELHEELAQLAAVVKMDLHWLQHNAVNIPSPGKAKLEHAYRITDLLINTIRRISFSISPGMLDDFGLDDVLEWHCREFSLLNGIACRFEKDYNESLLSKEVKLDFFRICQEAFSNIMYHAEASVAIIRIKETGDSIELSIEDDGKGFDIATAGATPGLTRIRERAASINAVLTVKSGKGEGTMISVKVAK